MKRGHRWRGGGAYRRRQVAERLPRGAVSPRLFRVLLAVVGTLAFTGCVTAADASGPVHPWRIHGVPFASAGTLGVYRGQSTDLEAYAINDAHAPVVVTAARLIRVPGYSSTPLIHVGIETGKAHMAIDRNWPPDGVTVRPLIGATLPHGRVYLAGGFASKRPGTYLAAGLHLTYRTGGRTFQTDAWGGGAACVAPGHPSSPPLCRHSHRLLNAMTDYIHQH